MKTDEVYDTAAVADIANVVDGNHSDAYKNERNTLVSCSSGPGYNKLICPLF